MADNHAMLRRLVEQGATWPQLFAAYPDVKEKTLRKRVERLGLKVGKSAPVPVNAKAPAVAPGKVSPELLGVESFESRGDTATVTATTDRKVKTLQDLVDVCEIDLDQWEIVSHGFKAYQGFCKDETTQEVKVTQLFSVKANLKARKLVGAVRDGIADILANLRANAPEPGLVLKPRPQGGRMLELSIPDAHLGKLAWHRECGQAYDVKIARALYMAAVDDLLAKVDAFGPFEEIVYVVGNDFLNADNFENTTARGTIQTTDGRQQKTFWTARRLVQEVVETRLRPRAQKVRIVMVGGNHDLVTTFYLGEVLDALFSRFGDVEVDNSPAQRKYVRWGQVLLGFTHGSEEKHQDLPQIMATEQKEAWGQTTFREWHIGHLHHKRATKFQAVAESFGVTVRMLPSLCAAEDWHTSKGYIGNVRSAEAYIWDRATGMVGSAVYNVPEYTDHESLMAALEAA